MMPRLKRLCMRSCGTVVRAVYKIWYMYSLWWSGAVSVEEVPDVEQTRVGVEPLQAAFDVAQPDAAASDILDLPSFAPPVLDNAPTEIFEDDFLTVYHPRSRRSPVIARFDQYNSNPPLEPLDPRRLSSAPWDPFQSRLDFEFAEFTQKAALSKEQVSTLLELVSHIRAEPDALSFKSYSDVKNAWEVASFMVPNVCTPVLPTQM